MTEPTTRTGLSNLHPLDRCAFCGSRRNLYRTFLNVTRTMSAVCEDPVACLRRRGKKDGW